MTKAEEVKLVRSKLVRGFYTYQGWTVEWAGKRKWLITRPSRYHAGFAPTLKKAEELIEGAE